MSQTIVVPASQVKFGLEISTEKSVLAETIEPSPIMTKKQKNKRILVVFRVSNQDLTTKNQEKAMEKHIADMLTPPAIRHITGSTWKKAIPEMTTLLHEVEQKQWDEIHFWRVCRTGRNHLYDVKLFDACIRNNVVLRFVDDNLRSDVDQDRLMFNMRSTIAEYERLLISKRTKEGIARKRAERKAKGLRDTFNGKKKGNRWGKTLKAIPLILDCLRAGHSMRRIASVTGLNQRTVMNIRDTPIVSLRKQTGNKTLTNWKE